MVDSLKIDLENAIKKNYVDATDAAQDVQKSVDDFNFNIQKSIDDFGSKITDLSNNVAEVTKMVSDLQKRVDAYEGATAVRKSGEVEQASADNTKITKSIWNGHFLNARDL
jgi:methyl-accepting chemotaxis protein